MRLQVTAYQIHEARTRFTATPPQHVPEGNFREIGSLFTVLHSLYFGLQLLSTDGVAQSFKYMEGKLTDNA